MIRFLIALVVLIVGLCVTNPSSDRHHEAVTAAMSEEIPDHALGEILKRTRLLGWEYQNYWFFSTSTLGDRQVSLGFLGFVFVES